MICLDYPNITTIMTIIFNNNHGYAYCVLLLLHELCMVLKTNSISWAQKQMLTIQTQQENDICFMINNLSLCGRYGTYGVIQISGFMSGTVSWWKTHILYIPHQSESLLWISASTCPSINIWRQTKSHQHSSFLYPNWTLYNSWDS